METVLQFFEQLIEANGIAWLIGQGFGIIAIILGFLSYQVHTQRQILWMQSAVAVVFCIHYALIGAYSALAMNSVNIVRNIAYDFRTRRNIKSKLIPLIFVAIQILMCALTWDGWFSVFVMIGICINTYCMSLSDPQTVRKSILVSSPFVLTYDIFVRSVGGSIYESIALISAAIGIIRFRKRPHTHAKTNKS